MGNDWAVFYPIIGPRKTGKSYAVAEQYIIDHKHYKDNCKNYWLRISETSTKKLKSNKAEKLFDPDLVRKYNLSISIKGDNVYNHGKKICEVLPLSQFGKLKGVGFYDKDFNGLYNIALDEFQLEEGEKRTSFDILYNFIGMLENIARTTKKNIRVFLLGNTLEEASTILKAFNFIPEKFGRFYLRKKRCVIDNIMPTKEYLEDREGSLANLLGGDDMSNFTNKIEKSRDLISKDRVKKPQGIIKFRKNPDSWFVLYEKNVVKRYTKETVAKEKDYCMRPYLDSFYSLDRRNAILEMYDSRALKFDSMITQAYFTDALSLLRITR